MFGNFGDDNALNPDAYFEHIIEHVEAGEMTLMQALQAASLMASNRSIDITEEWQCVLIALGEEELAREFGHVALIASKAGIGVTFSVGKSTLWQPSDVTPEQKQVMDRATMACLRRNGIEAHFHDDGSLHIPQPNLEDEDDVISKFIEELNELPEEDPDKRGWDKWTK